MNTANNWPEGGNLISELTAIDPLKTGLLTAPKITVRRFERGFSVVQRKRRTDILYRDVQSYSLVKSDSYMNGIASGLIYVLAIARTEIECETPLSFTVQIPPTGGVIVWTRNTRKNPADDATIEGIASQLCDAVLPRFRSTLDAGGSVAWSTMRRKKTFGNQFMKVAITPRGLELHDQLVRKCRWDEISNLDIRGVEENTGDGSSAFSVYTVRTTSQELPELTVLCNGMNSRPGWLLLRERVGLKESRTV